MTRALQKSTVTCRLEVAASKRPIGGNVDIQSDQRFEWLATVMAVPDLPPAAYRIAYYFAFRCAGAKSIGIFPSQGKIASDLSTSIDSVKRAIRVMSNRRLLRRVTTSAAKDDRRTSYILTWFLSGTDSPDTSPEIGGNSAPYPDVRKGADLHQDRVQICTIEQYKEPYPPPHGGGGIGITESIDSRNGSFHEPDSDPHWHLRRDSSDYLSMDDERRARDAPGSYPGDDNFPICAEGDDYDDCPF